jgi:Flp pilus assembly protein TadG
MAEAAIALPVILLVLLFGWNISQVAMTAMAAQQAVDYGARVASISHHNPEQWAKEAVQASLRQSGAYGVFSDPDVRIIGASGGTQYVRVTLVWNHWSIFRDLCRNLGEKCPRVFFGTATATWKREGY